MNKHSNRYVVPEDEDYEPESNNTVLKNFLGVKTKEQMDAIEKQELKRAELELFKMNEDHCFTASNICDIHELWLGDIYPFAGKYRTVNMAKENFLFAPAMRISDLMHQFEKKFLAKHTPCLSQAIEDLAFSLGVIHVEFILIHPFREGNGRTARLIADLMAVQAKMPPINYNAIDQTTNSENFEKYIKSIHAGLDENYKPIVDIFKLLLDDSI